MSQILDAINKAERERLNNEKAKQNKQDADSLYQSLSNSAPVSKPRRHLISAFVFIFFSGLIAYWVYDENGFKLPLSSTTQAQQVITISQAHLDIAEKRPQYSNRTQQPLIRTEKTTKIKTLTQKNNSAKPASTTLLLNKPGESTKSKSSKAQVINLNGQNKPDSTKAKPLPDRYDHQDLLTLTPIRNNQKKPSRNTTVIKPYPIPTKSIKPSIKTKKLTTVSKRIVQDIPISDNNSVTPSWKAHIHIAAIVYHQNNKKRFALIDGKKIFENQSIPGTNFKIIRIYPNKIIVNNGSGDIIIR